MKKNKNFRFSAVLVFFTVVAVYFAVSFGTSFYLKGKQTAQKTEEIAPIVAVPMLLFTSVDMINRLYEKNDK